MTCSSSQSFSHISTPSFTSESLLNQIPQWNADSAKSLYATPSHWWLCHSHSYLSTHKADRFFKSSTILIEYQSGPSVLSDLLWNIWQYMMLISPCMHNYGSIRLGRYLPTHGLYISSSLALAPTSPVTPFTLAEQQHSQLLATPNDHIQACGWCLPKPTMSTSESTP